MNLTQLIITIAVGAVIVLAGIWYGGPLLAAGTVGGHANTITNAGSNIALALSAYRSENPVAALPTLANLVSQSYLRSAPQVDGIVKTGTTFEIDATLGVTAAVANKDICDRINKNLQVPSAAALTASAQAAPTGIGTACFQANSAIGSFVANDYVYFLKA